MHHLWKGGMKNSELIFDHRRHNSRENIASPGHKISVKTIWKIKMLYSITLSNNYLLKHLFAEFSFSTLYKYYSRLYNLLLLKYDFWLLFAVLQTQRSVLLSGALSRTQGYLHPTTICSSNLPNIHLFFTLQALCVPLLSFLSCMGCWKTNLLRGAVNSC